MALLMTILTVLAMLGSMAALLWLSAFVESRKLGLPGTEGLQVEENAVGAVSVVGPVGTIAIGEIQPAA